MTVELHAELMALCARFHAEDISEEEWALLQIHMAYCDACQQMFTRYEKSVSDSVSQTKRAPEREPSLLISKSEASPTNELRVLRSIHAENPPQGVVCGSMAGMRHNPHNLRTLADTAFASLALLFVVGFFCDLYQTAKRKRVG